MLNVFRVTMLIAAAAIAYFGFGIGNDNQDLTREVKRRQAATNYFYRRECTTISQLSIVFGDGPGFNKTYEFREACKAEGMVCTFFVNPVTVDSQAALKGIVEALAKSGMEIGIAFPLYQSDISRLSQEDFKIQLYGYADSVRNYIGGDSFPRFVFFKEGIDWQTEQNTAKWALEMGFIPIKGQVYLQDLTGDAVSVLGTYKEKLDPYVLGGNRLKYVFSHTHMDQNVLKRSDIQIYFRTVQGSPYNYKLGPISQCFGESPYTGNIVQPKIMTGSSVRISAALWIYVLALM